MNLMMLLEMAASGPADRVALSCGEERLGAAQLMAAAAGAASLVREAGVAHVALLDESSPAFPIALFGASWAGRPFAPLSYRLTGEELEALLARLAPVLLVTSDERAAGLAGRSDVLVRARSRFLEEARDRGDDPAPPDWETDPDRIAVLLFTSGTTGPPKAAVLRQRHLVSYVLGSVEFGAAAADEATLVSVPPYHVAGIAALQSSLYAGRRIVQLPSFDPRLWLETARAERVTHAFVVPTMLARIVEALDDVADPALPSLRALAYGGGRMPAPVIARALERLPHTDFTNAYGLTETSSTLTLLGPEDHRAAWTSDDPEVRRRLGSVGRALPSVEIEIRDERGRRLEAGRRGEIHVRGEQVSGEYLGQGARLDPAGWFATRDAGWLDTEGYLFLEGRMDDVIVRGGENLSPGEIEEVLREHEAVADVGVVGVPDEEWGEAVAAAVVLHPGRDASADDLRAWVRERLRSSRMPREVRFERALPYNETGKLLRRELRRAFGASPESS